jgi:hypothetical protein
MLGKVKPGNVSWGFNRLGYVKLGSINVINLTLPKAITLSSLYCIVVPNQNKLNLLKLLQLKQIKVFHLT